MHDTAIAGFEPPAITSIPSNTTETDGSSASAVLVDLIRKPPGVVLAVVIVEPFDVVIVMLLSIRTLDVRVVD